MNLKAVDNTLEASARVCRCRRNVNGSGGLLPPVTANAPQFVKDVLGKLTAGAGERPARERVPGGRHVPDRHGAI